MAAWGLQGHGALPAAREACVRLCPAPAAAEGGGRRARLQTRGLDLCEDPDPRPSPPLSKLLRWTWVFSQMETG